MCVELLSLDLFDKKQRIRKTDDLHPKRIDLFHRDSSIVSSLPKEKLLGYVLLEIGQQDDLWIDRKALVHRRMDSLRGKRKEREGHEWEEEKSEGIVSGSKRRALDRFVILSDGWKRLPRIKHLHKKSRPTRSSRRRVPLIESKIRSSFGFTRPLENEDDDLPELRQQSKVTEVPAANLGSRDPRNEPFASNLWSVEGNFEKGKGASDASPAIDSIQSRAAGEHSSFIAGAIEEARKGSGTGGMVATRDREEKGKKAGTTTGPGSSTLFRSGTPPALNFGGMTPLPPSQAQNTEPQTVSVAGTSPTPLPDRGFTFGATTPPSFTPEVQFSLGSTPAPDPSRRIVRARRRAR